MSTDTPDVEVETMLASVGHELFSDDMPVSMSDMWYMLQADLEAEGRTPSVTRALEKFHAELRRRYATATAVASSSAVPVDDRIRRILDVIGDDIYNDDLQITVREQHDMLQQQLEHNLKRNLTDLKLLEAIREFQNTLIHLYQAKTSASASAEAEARAEAARARYEAIHGRSPPRRTTGALADRILSPDKVHFSIVNLKMLDGETVQLRYPFSHVGGTPIAFPGEVLYRSILGPDLSQLHRELRLVDMGRAVPNSSEPYDTSPWNSATVLHLVDKVGTRHFRDAMLRQLRTWSTVTDEELYHATFDPEIRWRQRRDLIHAAQFHHERPRPSPFARQETLEDGLRHALSHLTGTVPDPDRPYRLASEAAMRVAQFL